MAVRTDGELAPYKWSRVRTLGEVKVTGKSDSKLCARIKLGDGVGGYGENETTVIVENVEWETNGKRLVIKAYYPTAARDCDGWWLRTFQLTVENYSLDYASHNFIGGKGYAQSIGWFTPEEADEYVDGEDRVDSCFPPDRITAEPFYFLVDFQIYEPADPEDADE